jgi:hypothetical protein
MGDSFKPPLFLFSTMSHTCKFCGKEFKNMDELIKHLHEEHKSKVKLRKFEHPKRV